MSTSSSLITYLGLAAALALSGCSSDPEAVISDIPDACNPLGGVSCMTPWPSMAYATESADTAVLGRRP